MKPMLRPRTNRPFRVPILIYSSASSGVNAPLSRRRSTKQTAIHPSTLRMSYFNSHLSHGMMMEGRIETHGIFFSGSNLLDAKRVIEQTVAWEVFGNIFFHKFYTKIGVINTLDLVSNSTNYLSNQKNSLQKKRHHSLSLFAFLELSTNSRGVRPVSRAFENMDAASSRAPPNRLPIVKRPEANDEIKSLPAREATIVFMAPDTAGP
jgi:hypothetical protein